MSDPLPTPDLDRFFAEEDFLRQLAADLVGGDADDLVQQTWLQVLRSPPPDRLQNPRAWLQRVARNLAVGGWRSEGARRRRERVRGESVSTAVPSSEELAAREDRRRHLVAAVDALPESLRSVVLLRYFEGLGSNAVAARLGLPVHTVWNRQRAALRALRGALDREFGPGSHRALLLPLAAGARRSAAPMLMGWWGLSPALRAGVAAGLLLATGGVALGWSLGGVGAVPEAVSTAGAPAASVGAAHDAVPEEELPVVADPGPESLRTAPPEAVPEPRSVEGRCVDRQGNPVAGIRVEFLATMRQRSMLEQRIASQTALHGVPQEFEPPAQTTGSDGRFAFVLPTSLSGHYLHLNFSGDGWAPFQRNLGEIDAAELDQGDVRLTPGYPVHGFVRDRDGNPPVGRVHVRLQDYDLEREGLWGSSAQVEPDGSFVLNQPVAEATWNVHVQGAVPVGGGVVYRVGPAAAPLELLVHGPGELPKIRGGMVDEFGEPWRFHSLHTLGHGVQAQTDRQGRFELESPTGQPLVPAVRVETYFPQRWVSPKSYPWGSEDVRLVVPRGVPVSLTVLDARNRQPVTDYGAWFFPRPGSTSWSSSSEDQVRDGWEHAEGVADLGRAVPGEYVVYVEPAPETGLAHSHWHEVMVPDGARETIEVELLLDAPVEQELLLVDADGAPVAGAQVRLLYPVVGDTVDYFTTVLSPQASGSSMKCAKLWAEERSDAQGKVAFRGSPRRKLALRVDAPGFETELRFPFSLQAGSEEVELQSGRKLTVQLGPPRFLEILWAGVETPASGERTPNEIHRLPGLSLKRWPKWSETIPPRLSTPSKVPLDREGRAVFEGMPAGPYDVMMGSAIALDVDLAPGEHRTVDLDLSDRIPGRVSGRVFLDGEPLARKPLVFRGDLGFSLRGYPALGSERTETDGDGRFALHLAPGTWRVAADPNGWTSPSVQAGEPFVLAPDGQLDLDLDLRLYSRTLRLLDPAGDPVADLETWVLPTGRLPGHEPEPTDAEGRTMLQGGPGSYEIRVYCRSLNRREVREIRQMEWSADGDKSRAKLEGLQITLGPVELGPGLDSEVEIRLPPEWDR